MKKISWREVFDPEKFGFCAGAHISEINVYVRQKTIYRYFTFNGIIYESFGGYFDKTDLVAE